MTALKLGTIALGIATICLGAYLRHIGMSDLSLLMTGMGGSLLGLAGPEVGKKP